MKKLPILLSLLFLANITLAQATIQLKNPSFEDTPRHSHVPSGWKNCGQEFESPPDTQPDPTFGVNTKAFDGETYLGLVVRDNDTWEQVGQSLSDPLIQGTCYSFSLLMAKSATYNSASRRTGRAATYTTPVVVRIWGGNSNCEKQEMLAISEPVDNVEWLEYPFLISPIKSNYSHLLIEAYYKDRYGDAYNGNVLIDNASEIEAIDCSIPADSLRVIEQIKENQQLQDALLKKIIIPESIDSDLYWEWVWEYGSQIKFEKNGALATELYSNEEGKIMNGNIYLHYLALIAQELPQNQLHIYVHGRDAGLVKNRKEAIQQALYDWGFINERVKIFSNVGELEDPPTDLPEDALFFTTETLAFYLRQ